MRIRPLGWELTIFLAVAVALGTSPMLGATPAVNIRLCRRRCARDNGRRDETRLYHISGGNKQMCGNTNWPATAGKMIERFR